MPEMDHHVRVPRRLRRFIAAHPDARVSVHNTALLHRIPDDALPDVLHAVAAPANEVQFGALDFAQATQLARSARSDGSTHIVVDTTTDSFHLSAVVSTGATATIFIRHPSAGIGPVSEIETAPNVYRGSCDPFMHIVETDGDLLPFVGMGETPIDALRLDSLITAASIDDLIDCWVEASTIGTSSCVVQLKAQADDLDDWFSITLFVNGDHVDFTLVGTSDSVRARRKIETRNRLSNISETVPHGIFRISPSGFFLYRNSKIAEIFGDTDHLDFTQFLTTDGELMTVAVTRQLTVHEEARVDIVVELDGQERILRVRARMLPSPAGGSEYVGSLEDVTTESVLTTKLQREAQTDPLTGAANRRSLETNLNELLESSETAPFAVLLLDLDGFKQVNDSLGHSAGDLVIAQLGARLIDACRTNDFVARLGGDEFVMLVQNVGDYEAAMEFADRLLPIMRAPFVFDETTIELSGSIGVALAEHGATVRGVLQMADHAMYEAKRSGRNQAKPYHMPDAANPISPLALRRDLRRAIGAQELDLAFQPIFKLDNLIEPDSAESLLRWDHPTLGAVDPSTMISIAEQSGLIGELGEWILNEAVRAAAEINSERTPEQGPIAISVNVSALQVGRHDFVESVKIALDATGLSPRLLVLELTESYLVDQLSEGRASLNELTKMGVRLAIDDFGTGYSTFEYLVNMPVHAVKIDGSFTRRLADPRGKAMLSGLGAACRELGMLLVVEGVETEQQLLSAREAGATHAQGYLLGKPIRSRETALGTLTGDPRAA